MSKHDLISLLFFLAKPATKYVNQKIYKRINQSMNFILIEYLGIKKIVVCTFFMSIGNKVSCRQFYRFVEGVRYFLVTILPKNYT